MSNWVVRAHNVVFQTKRIEIIRDHIISPTNHSRYSTYINTLKEGVCIIPYISEIDSFIIVKQYRHPIKEFIWQFPAGTDENDSSQVSTANRELLEETGYTSTKFIDLGSFFPDSELIGNKGHFFIALDPKLSKIYDTNNLIEQTVPRILSNEDLSAAILNGDIRDSWTLAGYLLFKLWQQKNHKVIDFQ